MTRSCVVSASLLNMAILVAVLSTTFQPSSSPSSASFSLAAALEAALAAALASFFSFFSLSFSGSTVFFKNISLVYPPDGASSSLLELLSESLGQSSLSKSSSAVVDLSRDFFSFGTLGALLLESAVSSVSSSLISSSLGSSSSSSSSPSGFSLNLLTSASICSRIYLRSFWRSAPRLFPFTLLIAFLPMLSSQVSLIVSSISTKILT